MQKNGIEGLEIHISAFWSNFHEVKSIVLLITWLHARNSRSGLEKSFGQFYFEEKRKNSWNLFRKRMCFFIKSSFFLSKRFAGLLQSNIQKQHTHQRLSKLFNRHECNHHSIQRQGPMVEEFLHADCFLAVFGVKCVLSDRGQSKNLMYAPRAAAATALRWDEQPSMTKTFINWLNNAHEWNWFQPEYKLIYQDTLKHNMSNLIIYTSYYFHHSHPWPRKD